MVQYIIQQFIIFLLLGIKTAENEKNYKKLQELLKRAVMVILNFFYLFFPSNPTELYNELKKNEHALNKLRNRGIISDHQLNLLFPSGRQTFAEQFDISLMRVLIANFAKTGKSKNYWISIWKTKILAGP